MLFSTLLTVTAPVQAAANFNVMETTVADIQAAYQAHTLTAHQVVQLYLDRVAAYDQKGPALNVVIELNPTAMAEADKLDAEFAKTGKFVGPLHGIPVFLKDQFDAAGMRTTLGSVLLKDYHPTRDSFVSAKLRAAGAIIMGKNTLGELGGGDSYGSLYGVSHNPYALDRTVGGSSGGTAASLAANFSAIGVGEEGSSSIRRPSAWNNVVGMRPTAGLVSRGGMWDGWPAMFGSLGPVCRTVTDLAKTLDVMVGYDPEDPLTAYGVGHVPKGSYTQFLDKNGLKGARIGVIRESIVANSDINSPEFKSVDAAYAKAVEELKAAGAIVVDNIIIPDIKKLVATRASAPGEVEGMVAGWFARNASDAPFKTREEMYSPENIKKVSPTKHLEREGRPNTAEAHYQYLMARQELTTNLLKVMADNKLDVILHKSTEYPPNLISYANTPPYPGTRGVIALNTFLVFVPVISVPAGFTDENLPIGITFLGRAYDEPTILKLAYAYEQATHHRVPPKSTPPLDTSFAVK